MSDQAGDHFGVSTCVWIEPGDKRRGLCVNAIKLAFGVREYRDLCTCCGEIVECDAPHLCQDCCQGHT